MRTNFRLPSGPLGWAVMALAATAGLFLVIWLLATFWVLALGAGAVGSLAYGWRRLQDRFRPRVWRRLPRSDRRL